MTFCHKNIKKNCRGNLQIGHFFARIIDYALVDSFWGCPSFIDNPTSSATLAERDIHYHRHDYQRLQHSLADIIFSMDNGHYHRKLKMQLQLSKTGTNQLIGKRVNLQEYDPRRIDSPTNKDLQLHLSNTGNSSLHELIVSDTFDKNHIVFVLMNANIYQYMYSVLLNCKISTICCCHFPHVAKAILHACYNNGLWYMQLFNFTHRTPPPRFPTHHFSPFFCYAPFFGLWKINPKVWNINIQ